MRARLLVNFIIRLASFAPAVVSFAASSYVYVVFVN